MGGASRRARAGLIAAVIFAAGAGEAQGAVLKNDSFTTGGESNCQTGFVAGESAAAAFAAPPGDYPIQIESIQALGCVTTGDVSIDIYGDSLDSTPDPDGTALASPGDFVLAPGLQTFDVSAQNIVIPSGGIRVALTGVSAGVPIATDDNGITSHRNSIFSEAAWNFSETFGIQNDFVIRAVYSPVAQVEITQKPKKKVKTKGKKAVVTFKFTSSSDGSSFECKLDDKEFAACSSPQIYKAGVGKHRFQVRAIVGDTQGDPASYGFKVVKG